MRDRPPVRYWEVEACTDPGVRKMLAPAVATADPMEAIARVKADVPDASHFWARPSLMREPLHGGFPIYREDGTVNAVAFVECDLAPRTEPQL